MNMKMNRKLSCGVSVLVDKMNGKTIYVARCDEMNISDFGYTVEEALDNLRSALRLLIKAEPSKAKYLRKEEPLLVTRIFL